MKAISRKLKNTRGATMLLAMLLMLVAMTVSLVILSAAITAASNVQPTRQQQQAYLTVSSAAEPFYEALKGEGGAYSITRTGNFRDASLTQEMNHSFDLSPAPDVPYGPIFKSMLENLLKCWAGRVGTMEAPDYSESFAITTEDQEIESINLNITLTAIMDGNRATGCTLRAEFSTDADSGSLCKILVQATGTIVASQRPYVNDLKKIHDLKVEWSSVDIDAPKIAVKDGTGA